MTTKAEQIAGYLKLTSAHYSSIAHDSSETVLDLRIKLANEMDPYTLWLAHELCHKMGGWYDGDKNYSDARKLEAAYASVR